MIGYILQEEIKTEDREAYEPDPIPRTVIMWDYNMLRKLKVSQIINDSRNKRSVYIKVKKDDEHQVPTHYWGNTFRENDFQPTDYLHFKNPLETSNSKIVTGLQIPDPIVTQWGLRNGDQVEVKQIERANEHMLVIWRVNGCPDPEFVRTRPKIAEVEGPDTEYPNKQVPIGKHGCLEIQFIESLAPVGYGQLVGAAGAGGSGKSIAFEQALSACCPLTKTGEVDKLLVCFLGERPEDKTEYGKILQNHNPRHGSWELYEASWNDKAFAQVQIAEWFMDRVRALTSMGLNIVYFFDSISRLAEAISDVGDKEIFDPAESGIVTGGQYRRAIRIAAEKVKGNGNFGDHMSCTGFNTMLLPANDDFGKAEAGFALSVLQSRFNSYWIFLGGDGPYPQVAVMPKTTYTRESERFLNYQTQERNKALELYCWGKFTETDKRINDAYTAHLLRLQWFQEHAAGIAPDIVSQLGEFPRSLMHTVTKSARDHKMNKTDLIYKSVTLYNNLVDTIQKGHFRLLLMDEKEKALGDDPARLLKVEKIDRILLDTVFLPIEIYQAIEQAKKSASNHAADIVGAALHLYNQITRWEATKLRIWVLDEREDMLRGYINPDGYLISKPKNYKPKTP